MADKKEKRVVFDIDEFLDFCEAVLIIQSYRVDEVLWTRGDEIVEVDSELVQRFDAIGLNLRFWPDFAGWERKK